MRNNIRYSRIKKFFPLLFYSILITLSLLIIIQVIFTSYQPQPPAIVIEFATGIGNQLFKFASAYALSKSLGGVPIYLVFKQKHTQVENTFSSELKNPLTRAFTLDMFQVPITSENTLTQFSYYLRILFSKHTKEYSCQDLYEGRIQYGNKYFVSNDYCHSQEYFKNYIPDITNLFQFSKKFLNISESSKSLKVWEKKITNGEISVAVHIRLGDYLPQREAWVTPKCFYQEAISKMIKMLCGKIINFFIFSDSIDHVKQHFQLNANNSSCLLKHHGNVRFYFVSSKELTSIEEFYLMTFCLHAIISNSTFSWWAAYLIKNKDKVVIAPVHNKRTLEGYNDPGEKMFKTFMQKFNYPLDWIVLNPY